MRAIRGVMERMMARRWGVALSIGSDLSLSVHFFPKNDAYLHVSV